MSQEPINQSSSLKRTPSPSFIKLAMRNMVRKGSKSLTHLALTGVIFFAFILVIAVVGRPSIPH